MGWLREWVVTSGRIWFKPDEGEDLHTVEAFLELADPLWVWFQDIDCSVPFAVPDASSMYQVEQGRIALESRLEPSIPQPQDLVEL